MRWDLENVKSHEWINSYSNFVDFEFLKVDMDRGSGDGAEDIQIGAQQPPQASGGAPVDMSGPAATEMVQLLVGMGISQVDAEMVLLVILH